MPNLWTLLRQKPPSGEARYSFNDWADDRLTFGGMTYPLLGMNSLGRTQEDIENSFTGYINGAYKSNGPIFACVLARLLLFTEARFCWQDMRTGRPGELTGGPDLGLLERPWPNGTTGELLARMEQDVSLAGNAFVAREAGRLRRLRPDWVSIILTARPDEAAEVDVAGYAYRPGGTGEPVFYLPDELCHWSPIPDPEALYRGMSWVTPVVREIQADKAATQHKLAFFANGATLNAIVSFKETVTPQQFKDFVGKLDAGHAGAANAYKTLYVGGGADVSLVGSDLKQLDFRAVQGAGETRVTAAAGVPAVIVGLSEGLQAATYCLPGDAMVWAQAGPTPIAGLRAGDMVWSHVDGGLALRRVTWQARTGEKRVYTIRTRNRTLRASGNHPVLTRVEGNRSGRSASVEWRNVEDLHAGDQVVQVMSLPDEVGGQHLPGGDLATPEAMMWLGAYVGDGCLNGDHSVRMCIPEQDRVRDVYAKLAQRLFTKATTWARPSRRAQDGLTETMVKLRADGLSYRQIVAEMGIDLHPMSVRDRVRTSTRDYSGETDAVAVRPCRNGFQFSSVGAVGWHQAMGVVGTARTKRVPRWVFSLGAGLRLAFLAGLVDTDGHIDKRGSLSFRFASQGLVDDVRMLVVGLGIQCSNIRRVEVTAAVLPNPGARDKYESWEFTASSADEVSAIPFTDWLYRERVESNTGRRRRAGGDAAKAGLDPDVLGFFTVTSIEAGEAEPVYDISVDEGRSFVADGVIVHNSNYGQARRKFGDHWARPTWRSVCAALEVLVPPRKGSRLWYDDRDIAFLREDQKDAAEIQRIKSSTIRLLVDAGYTPDSVVASVEADDRKLLVHSGLYSVQLQPAGSGQSALPGRAGQLALPGGDDA